MIRTRRSTRDGFAEAFLGRTGSLRRKACTDRDGAAWKSSFLPSWPGGQGTRPQVQGLHRERCGRDRHGSGDLRTRESAGARDSGPGQPSYFDSELFRPAAPPSPPLTSSCFPRAARRRAQEQRSPLLLMVTAGCRDVVQLLLTAKADVERASEVPGRGVK
jgi:hypothetical protein